MIEAGTTAPEFTLPDQEGDEASLSGFRGSAVVLYYADTPGCTTQACWIRDHRADCEAAGAVVLGVSPDPVEGRRQAVAELAPARRRGPRRLRALRRVGGEVDVNGRAFRRALRATFILDEVLAALRGLRVAAS